jgi:outer membrane biosynthesis protein TonB
MQKFESEKRLTKISGTISKRGKSSIDSKSTELGRYWDQVSKEIETVWQKEALANREFNMPGSLRMSFVIAPSGDVSHIRITSRAGASSIQQSYTVKAIRNASIPKMPPVLVKELFEEPIEMQITFNF